LVCRRGTAQDAEGGGRENQFRYQRGTARARRAGALRQIVGRADRRLDTSRQGLYRRRNRPLGKGHQGRQYHKAAVIRRTVRYLPQTAISGPVVVSGLVPQETDRSVK